MVKDSKLSIYDYLLDHRTRAVGALFVMNAFLFSQWVVRIPDVKELLNLTDAKLGLALLASPLGVVVITPLVSMGIRKLGPGKISIMGGIIYAITIIAIGFVNSFTALVATLFLLGFANGAMDISMNAVVSALEKIKSSIFMSMTHGFWSLSAMVFSLVASFIVSTQIGIKQHLALTGILSVLFLFFAFSIYNIKDANESQQSFRLPDGSVLVLVIIAFAVFLTEGGIMDWNAVFYKDVLASPEYMLGFGFAAFSFAMAIARFYGDKLIEKYATRKLLLFGCLILAGGLLLFSFGFSIISSTIAMVVSGLGCSILIPVLFRQAGLLDNVPPSVGIATVSTLGYTGFLAGPPLIGFLSESFSLEISFSLLALLIGLAGLLSLRLKV